MPKLTKRFKRNMSYRAADENIIAVYSSEVAAATCRLDFWREKR